MKNILVPTDFSENAANAMHYAAALASTTKGKLVLVHTLPLQVMASAESAVYNPIDPVLLEYYTNKLDVLAQELKAENSFGFEVETYCKYGPFHQVVNDLVLHHHAELVVMGAKGATSFMDRMFGTTTATYMKVAFCPVLAVPSAARFSALKKIAYASDFTGDDRVFLKQLFDFSEPFPAEVYIVNVKTHAAAPEQLDDRMLEDISRQFPHSRFCIAQVRADSVTEGIKGFLIENDIHLLAVSIHERGILEDLFHKSVAKQLALETTVPLLSLPEKPYTQQDLHLSGDEAVAG